MQSASRKNRHPYAYGYKSADAAWEAMQVMISNDELSPCEGIVEPYKAKESGKYITMYAVTIPFLP